MSSSSHEEVKQSDSEAGDAAISPVNRSISAEAPSRDGGTFSQVHATNLSGRKATVHDQLLAASDRKFSPGIHDNDDRAKSNVHADEPPTQDGNETKQKSTETILSDLKIKEPLQSDVIFGRGKPNHDHPGNRTLRTVVETFRDEYAASRRYDKLAITQEIITGLEAGRWSTIPARFLKRDDNSDFWTIASEEEIRDKVSHALRGKKRPPDSESHKTGKMRKNNEDMVTKPASSNTAYFPNLYATGLGSGRHPHQQQRNQYDQLPSYPALSRIPGEGAAEMIRMQSVAAAAAVAATARPSLSQIMSMRDAQSPTSHLFRTSTSGLPPAPLMMVHQPSLEEVRREVMLRLRAEEAFRQQQEVRMALSSSNTNLLLRGAMMRPIGSQLFSVQEQHILSNPEQARQEHLLQQVILQRQVLERQQQQQQQQQLQQQHTALARLLLSTRGTTRPNQKSEESPPSPQG